MSKLWVFYSKDYDLTLAILTLLRSRTEFRQSKYSVRSLACVSVALSQQWVSAAVWQTLVRADSLWQRVAASAARAFRLLVGAAGRQPAQSAAEVGWVGVLSESCLLEWCTGDERF